MNGHTSKESVPSPQYHHVGSVVRRVLDLKRRLPNIPVHIMSGDAASAFRNVPLHEGSGWQFTYRIPELDILVLELCCPFGWSGSPGFYDLFARAIKHVQAKTVDPDDANGSIGPYFAYSWVDDHIPVEPDIRNRCKTAEFALKGAIVTVLGPNAINYGKVTNFSEEECVLGVDLDTAG